MSNDLSLRPPRSPRVRLGGYVLLPRMLDKCRAEIAGKAGEYRYNCPLDQQFLDFVGIDSEMLKAEVVNGGGDGEVLAWIEANASQKRANYEIAEWSRFHEDSMPRDNSSREFINGILTSAGGAARADVGTWFEALDLDDYASFGGKC